MPTPRCQVLRGVRPAGGDRPVDLVVADGRVRAVAPTGASALAADDEVVDLDGRVVLPGLVDAHVHVAQWAAARVRPDLGDARDLDTVLAVLAEACAAPDAPPVVVATTLRAERYGIRLHRDLLDRVAGDRVVLVHGADLHTAWTGSAGLARLGWPDHPTGELGEADGFRAMTELTTRSAADVDREVAGALAAAAALGVTGLHDFEFGDAVGDWQRRAADGPLPVRVVTTVYPDHLDAAVARGWPTGTAVPGTGGMVTAGHLKVFTDGALNSRTAWCHEPYPDGTHGEQVLALDELVALLGRAWGHGIAPAVHAIGDRAVTLAVDAFEQVGCPGRVEHAQLVAAADVTRLARPGLVVGVQPAHLLDDRDVADRLWAGRTDRVFPLADLVAAGAVLELGSDAPVSPLDPWRGLAAAVARRAGDDPPWHPEQALTREQALAATCRGRTRLAAGDPADLVVVDDGPLTCDVAALATPAVHATMCAGRWTHGQHMP